MSRLHFIIIFLFSLSDILGNTHIDSLQNFFEENIDQLEFSEVERIIEENKSSLKELKTTILLIDQKFKSTENPKSRVMMLLWKAASYSGDEKSILLAESAYDLAKFSSESELEFRALYRLGIEYYFKNQVPEALSYFYSCKELLGSLDEIHTVRLDHAFGLVDTRLENYEKANEKFVKNIEFFSKADNRKKYPVQYLYSILGSANLYLIIGEYDKSVELINYGLIFSEEINSTSNYNNFLIMIGIAHYSNGEYDKSINYLEKVVSKAHPHQAMHNDGLKFIVAGYLATDNLDSALYHLALIEEVFEINEDYALRALQFAYAKINTYLEDNAMDSLHYVYLNKQAEIDALFDIAQRDIANTVINENDEASSKYSLFSNNDLLIAVIVVIIVAFSLALLMFMRLGRKIGSDRALQTKVQSSQYSTLDLNLKQRLLLELCKFEENEGFLENSISLSSLSQIVGTNPSYLSKVINSEKGKSFSKYIKGLRIAYTKERLTKDSVFANYSLKVMAEESGFRNYKSFSRAFEEISGEKPSEYLNRNIVDS